jgi:hypothetical protein
MDQQLEFVQLVDGILAEFERNGYPLPSEAQKRVDDLERQIDAKVAALYRT